MPSSSSSFSSTTPSVVTVFNCNMTNASSAAISTTIVSTTTVCSAGPLPSTTTITTVAESTISHLGSPPPPQTSPPTTPMSSTPPDLFPPNPEAARPPAGSADRVWYSLRKAKNSLQQKRRQTVCLPRSCQEHILCVYEGGGYELRLASPPQDPPSSESWVRLSGDLPAVELRPGDVFTIGKLEFTVQRFNTGVGGLQGYRHTMEDEDVVVQDLVLTDGFDDHIHRNLHKPAGEEEKQTTCSGGYATSSTAANHGGIPTTTSAEGLTIIPSHVSCPPPRCPVASFFAVYDGHGGRQCAEYIRRELHENFRHQLLALCGSLRLSTFLHHHIAEALRRSFLLTDHLFLRRERDKGARAGPGCAAVVVVLVGSSVFCANCGDARAVLCRAGGVVQLSCDHKPDREDEAARIREAGGFIRSRRVLGRLAVSRAFGDVEYKTTGALYRQPLVIAEPEIRVERLGESDEFLLLACDGLFDVFSSEEAVRFARERLSGMPRTEQDPQRVVEQLVREAIDVRKSRDNVTAILVTFKRHIHQQLRRGSNQQW
eukprot:GHVS01026835.1.p1 GENE.GHVS01026835.1~~GHVS01026835.1.p1  ORF type:complete len:604 (-),score=135.14 GHVS01026835.1:478-2106(-)